MDKILATTSSFGTDYPDIHEELSRAGLELVTNPFGRKLTQGELQSLLQEHSPIGLLAGTESIAGDTLAQAGKSLTVISRVGVGWDNVDRAAADALGIKVYRTAGVLDQAVAELTLGLILAALRNIALHDRAIRKGIWHKCMGSLLMGKKVGIIGFGAIGSKVASLVHCFGAEVVFTDVQVSEKPAPAVAVTFSELIEQAEIITLHASGNDCLIGDAQLAACREDVIIVNTARGGLVDEAALFDHLESGRVAYACLDVFAEEPYKGPLTRLENVILTTHVGSYAREARIRMEQMAVRNLLEGLKNT